MKKRLLAITLLLGLLNTYFLPLQAMAIENVQTAQVEQKSMNLINMDWWKDYQDDYLSEYIMKALANNQDLKIATLRVEESRQYVKMQFANELPHLSAGVSPAVYKMQGVTNSEGVFSIPIVMQYEADLFLKNRDKTKSKKKSYEASKFDEKAIYLSIASGVGTTYYNLVKVDKLISIQEELISDRAKIFELMKQSNDAGLVSTADLVKANKNLVAAKSDMIELKKTQETLLNAMAVLIGDSPNNISEYRRISYDKLTNAKGTPDEISTEIITSRPDYLRAEKMVEKAGIDVRVAKKEFLPSINLLGLLSFNTSSISSSMNWANALALAGASAMLPLFTGGANIARFRVSKNQYEQVLQNYYKTNLTAIQEVNDSLSNLKLDNEKYKQNVSSMLMEKQDFNYSQQRYDAGIMSYLDLIQRKENLLVMQKVVAVSKTDCFIDQINLYKATAGNFNSKL